VRRGKKKKNQCGTGSQRATGPAPSPQPGLRYPPRRAQGAWPPGWGAERAGAGAGPVRAAAASPACASGGRRLRGATATALGPRRGPTGDAATSLPPPWPHMWPYRLIPLQLGTITQSNGPQGGRCVDRRSLQGRHGGGLQLLVLPCRPSLSRRLPPPPLHPLHHTRTSSHPGGRRFACRS
jgi:hypothetical protein